MGGGKEVVERNNQWAKASDELTEVQFYVRFGDYGNAWLFDRDKLYRSLCKKVSKYLDDYGVKNTDMGPVDGGGGGFETLWEILQKLWEHKDIIEFALSVFGFIKGRWQIYQSKIKESLSPRIDIYFLIESTSRADLLKDDLDYLLQKNTANLLTVAEGVADRLSDDFKGFMFDVILETRVKSLDYSVHFSYPQEKRTELNTNRLFNVINSIVTRKNHHTAYSFTKWFAIQRHDHEVVDNPETYEVKNVRKYYLLFSSTILKDKFKWFR